MSGMFFVVNLPDGRYRCVLSLRNYTFSAYCDSDDGALEPRTGTSVTPDQIVYLIKEFSLLNTFRMRVYRFLAHFDAPVQFTVIAPKNGNLIDHAW